jgi:STE24 endopeptidase
MTVPAPVPIFSPEELTQILVYHHPRYLYGVISAIVFPAVSVLALRYLVRPLYAWSQHLGAFVSSPILARVFGGSDWSTALIFTFFWFLWKSLLQLPGDIYFDYVQPKAFGLVTDSWASYAVDVLKGELIFVAAAACLTFGLFGLARRLRHWWWILGLCASVALLGSPLLDPFRSTLYLEQTSLPSGELRASIFQLMAQAQVEVFDIKVDHDSAKSTQLQAYFAGTGPTRAVILGDNLLASLTESEVLAAVAHEAGHVGESKLVAQLASVASVMLLLAGMEWLFRKSARQQWFGVRQRADVRALPLLFFLFGLATMVVEPVTSYFSRARETQADEFAVALTHNRPAFVSMLVKVARGNKVDPAPPVWWVWWGVSHPPMQARVEHLMSKQDDATAN